MDGGENTEKDTRPVLRQNNYLDFMCTQQLLLGGIAATFLGARARTGKQKCVSVVILCILCFIFAASLDLPSRMLKFVPKVGRDDQSSLI